ncbi:hypothetical protein LINGRAHAP2_LOCUS13651 [Linum grandiflorum]
MTGGALSKEEWSQFGVWAQRWWGVQVGEREPLSDDLWCLKLPTKKDVERIMRLGRWQFKDRLIKADCWCPYAGCSDVVARSGVMWLKFDGIPLHFRSLSLFRQLGDTCGHFIAFNAEGCSLNSVRVKIKQSGVIPTCIPVTFLDQCFLVQVSVERGRSLISGWRVAGSEVYIRTSDIRGGLKEVADAIDLTEIEIPKTIGSGMGVRVDVIEADISESEKKEDDKVGGLQRKPLQSDNDKRKKVELGKEVVGESVRGEDLQMRIETAGGEETACTRVDKGVFEFHVGEIGSRSTVDNMTKVTSLNKRIFELGIGPSPSVASGNMIFKMKESVDEAVKIDELGLIGPPTNFLSFEVDELDVRVSNELSTPQTTSFSLALAEERFFNELGRCENSAGTDEVEAEEGAITGASLEEEANEIEDEEGATIEVSLAEKSREEDDGEGIIIEADMDDGTREDNGELDDEGGEEEDEVDRGDDDVLRLSFQIAEHMGLKERGSRIEADCTIKRAADDVLAKRNGMLSKSKTERELHRLHIDSSFSDGGDRRTRRQRGKVISSIPYDC